MARIYHNPQVEKIIGAHSKNGLIERQKHYRDYDGNITRIGKPEGYIPTNPRNYKYNPPVGNELANLQAFGRSSHDAQEFIEAWKHNTPLPPAKQAFLEQVKVRFRKQLNGKPDPIAPKDKDGNYTIYARPDNFLRAVLLKEPPIFD